MGHPVLLHADPSKLPEVTLKTLRQIALILSQLKFGHLITSLTKFEEKAREVGVHLSLSICRGCPRYYIVNIKNDRNTNPKNRYCEYLTKKFQKLLGLIEYLRRAQSNIKFLFVIFVK